MRASPAEVLRTRRHVPRARCKSDAKRYFRNLQITLLVVLVLGSFFRGLVWNSVAPMVNKKIN